jgi:hypothetical protein
LTELAELRNWLFKGLAAEAALDGIETDGLAVRASNDPRAVQRVIPLEDFSGPIRRSAMRSLPAYLAFFCLENAVRELVADRLTENHGATWWSTCASKSIRDRVESRRQQEGVKRWHIRRGEAEIYYTDFGDLRSLIQSNWSDFEDLFPDQNWVSSRLDELESSRNVIAHSNVLDDREIGRIALYLQDWTRQVG